MKKLREDQARLQGLLKETITLLCKNGLHFKNGFNVSALIGITTDNDETFLVEVKETVGDLEEENGEGEKGDGDGRARASRKRPPDGGSHSTPSKRHRDSDDDDSDNYASDDEQDMSNVKREPGDDGGDLVFVKQEHSDYESGQNTSSQYPAQPGHSQQAYGNPPDGSFDGSSHDGSSTWNQSAANLDPNQMAIAAQSQSGSQQVCTSLRVRIVSLQFAALARSAFCLFYPFQASSYQQSWVIDKFVVLADLDSCL